MTVRTARTARARPGRPGVFAAELNLLVEVVLLGENDAQESRDPASAIVAMVSDDLAETTDAGTSIAPEG